MAEELDLSRLRLAGITLDAKNRFRFPIEPEHAELLERAIGERRHFRLRLSSGALQFEGMVLRVGRSTASCSALFQALTTPELTQTPRERHPNG